MSRTGPDEIPFDVRAFALRLLRAMPWALGAALLATALAALVDARVPPVYLSSFVIRLTPPPGPLPEGVSWPVRMEEVQALLLSSRTRAEVAKDPEAREALGEAIGPEGEPVFSSTYAERISVFPGTTGGTVWIVARDPDPARADRLARRVLESGEIVAAASLAESRDRLEASFAAARAKHIEEIKAIDARLAQGEAASKPGENASLDEEVLLARRRVRLGALEEIEREVLAVEVSGLAGARPWVLDPTTGISGAPVPRDRLRPILGPALFAAALALLVRLLRDGRASRG